jgi:ATP-dependent Lon protease
LDKLGTDTDDTAKFKRIASEVNKQYTWELKDLEKLLKDLKVPDSEAEKISKEVAKVRNSSPNK